LKMDELSTALEALRDRPIVAESREYAQHWARQRKRAVTVTAVGSVVGLAAICVAAYMLSGWPGSHLRLFARNVFETGLGKTQAITLDDGSSVLLDRRSRLRVAFTSTTRDVELLEGQAHFEVAKEAGRPFRVRTSSAEVVAVGTTFDVANLRTRTTVTLIEGRVNVRNISGATASETKVEALVPGQQLGIAGDGEFLDKKEVKLENVTAWQRGTLVLDDMPLADALTAMNRYSTTQIVIHGSGLQSRRISGVFRIGDVDTEAIALQRYFNLREAARSPQEIILEHN
jgi:transmembrane sensor